MNISADEALKITHAKNKIIAILCGGEDHPGTLKEWRVLDLLRELVKSL